MFVSCDKTEILPHHDRLFGYQDNYYEISVFHMQTHCQLFMTCGTWGDKICASQAQWTTPPFFKYISLSQWNLIYYSMVVCFRQILTVGLQISSIPYKNVVLIPSLEVNHIVCPVKKWSKMSFEILMNIYPKILRLIVMFTWSDVHVQATLLSPEKSNNS